MKTLKEIYTGVSGIAAIFAANYSTDFAAFFDNTTPQTVDTFILFKYGNKPLCETINAENAVDIVKSVIALKLSVWRKMHAALSAVYNAAANVETKTKTGTLQRDGSTNSTDTAAKKAFNDTDFADDTQNESNGTSELTDTYNLTETNTITNNAAEKISNEITLRQRNNLQIAIIDGIIKEITLKVY